MKLVKLGLISIVAFGLLFSGLSLLFPSRVRVSRAIDISGSADQVLSRLRDTASWAQWYPVPPGSKGFPVLQRVTDSSVVASFRQDNGRTGTAVFVVYPASVAGLTTLHWYIDFRMRWYPWEKFSALLLERRYGPMMESALGRFKANTLGQP